MIFAVLFSTRLFFAKQVQAKSSRLFIVISSAILGGLAGMIIFYTVPINLVFLMGDVRTSAQVLTSGTSLESNAGMFCVIVPILFFGVTAAIFGWRIGNIALNSFQERKQNA